MRANLFSICDLVETMLVGNRSMTLLLVPLVITREQGRDLTRSYDKLPYTNRKIQNAKWQHKNATKNLDYTTVADRLRTVMLCNQKDTHKKTGNNPPYWGRGPTTDPGGDVIKLQHIFNFCFTSMVIKHYIKNKKWHPQEYAV